MSTHVRDLWNCCLLRLQRLQQSCSVCPPRHALWLLVQVWRPLKGPVDESPLGVIDASTVDKDDLMQNTLHFPNRTGYTYAVKHNIKHK